RRRGAGGPGARDRRGRGAAAAPRGRPRDALPGRRRLAREGASVTALLVVDIGNTNVSLGLFDYPVTADGEGPGTLTHHWRRGTHREYRSDEVGMLLTSLFTQARRDVGEVSDVIISSVVPPLLPIYERVSQKLFDRPSLIVGPGIRTGMPVRYENPREVGA